MVSRSCNPHQVSKTTSWTVQMGSSSSVSQWGTDCFNVCGPNRRQADHRRTQIATIVRAKGDVESGFSYLIFDCAANRDDLLIRSRLRTFTALHISLTHRSLFV